MLALEAKNPNIEVCDEALPLDASTAEPFATPMLEVLGQLKVTESTAMLRYIALKYCKPLYPSANPVTCYRIDYAIDDFFSTVYRPHVALVSPLLGVCDVLSQDNATLYATCTTQWMQTHLRGKFVTGDSVSIADFQIVPFFFQAMQPAVQEKAGFTPPQRMIEYCQDFQQAVKQSLILTMRERGASIADAMAEASEAIGKVDIEPTGTLEVRSLQWPSRATIREPQTATAPAATKERLPANLPKVHGMPCTAGSCGPVIFGMHTGTAQMVFCNVMKGENKTLKFKAINAAGTVPALEDGAARGGESTAILRYLSMKNHSQYYPQKDLEQRCRIDAAMEAFVGEVCCWHQETVDVAMGFRDIPDSKTLDDACAKYVQNLCKWMREHVSGKFVAGDTLSIADFKVAPYLYAAMQPVVQNALGITIPTRVVQYCRDFCGEVSSSALLHSAGGSSIAEHAASLEGRFFSYRV